MRRSSRAMGLLALMAAGAFLVLSPFRAGSAPAETLHYAPNHNFDRNGRFLPGAFDFNLADIDDPGQLKSLPDNVRALVWVGMCEGVTPQFLHAVTSFIGDPRVFGFFLMDDPDPRAGLLVGSPSKRCDPGKLREESDWLHGHMPGAKTMIVLMNLHTALEPFYDGSYNPDRSHVDLFGLSAYPCRTEWHGCDNEAIARYVAAAEASGIPRSRLVPVYQAFGGGLWRDDGGGSYILPTAVQEAVIIKSWAALVSNPVLDMAYSWGSQRGDHALEDAEDLRHTFLGHNTPTVDPLTKLR